MWRAVPKKRWSSLKILGRECEGQLIRCQGLPFLFVNVHQIEAAAFTANASPASSFCLLSRPVSSNCSMSGRSRRVSKPKCAGIVWW